MKALVLVASTRAAEGVYPDRSGRILAEWLTSRGFETEVKVVADLDMQQTVKDLFAGHLPEVILSTGGTGITPDDLTVEAFTPFVTRPMDGIVQAFYAESAKNCATAALSRMIAGMHGHTFVMTLPGSTGACRDGIAVLEPLLGHIVQLTKTPGAGHSDPHAVGHAHQHGRDAGHQPEQAPGAAAEKCAGQARVDQDPDYVQQQVSTVVTTALTEQPLEELLGELRRDTHTNAMGAVVTFEGIVRDHDAGVPVAALRYSAHPIAAEMIANVASRVAAQFPVRLSVVHRVGDIAIGELAFVVVAAAAHRHAAFDAARLTADAVKAEVPIWKEQQLADGSNQWVGID